MQRTLSNMNYIILVIDTHMNICKNPCHVYKCAHVHCTRVGFVKTLKWLLLLTGKGAKLFGSATILKIEALIGKSNKTSDLVSEGFPNFSAFIFTLIYSLYFDFTLLSLPFFFGICPKCTVGMDSTEGQEAMGESCLSEKLYLDLRS